jgi:hypothetical protein
MLLKIFVFFMIVFNFNGCFSLIDQLNMSNLSKETNFSSISKKLSSNICSSITSFSTSDVYVTDFVNISNLKNASDLGFLLSDEFKVALLSNCEENLKIKELTLGQNLRLGKHGVSILSRDLSKLKRQSISSTSKIVVGTYAITQQKLIVFVKVIDLTTGNILYSSNVSVKLNKEILKLEGIDDTLKIYSPMVL